MFQTISIASKPAGDGAASDSRSHRPKIADNISWRRDGEADQLIIVSKEDLPLPLILNPTAALIFSLCDGRHSLEKIAERLCAEFNQDDFSLALEDVKKQIEHFVAKCIVSV